MKKFQVITDSTSDVELKFREELGLDYAKMIFTLDGKDYDACLDWSEISAHDFYESLRKGSKIITGLVTAEQFEKKFEEFLSQGLDVLYISCSSKLSGSVNNGKIVAEELKEKYPDRKIICVDSLRSNYAEAMIAMTAAKMANDGKNIEEAAAFVEEKKLQYCTYATVGTLTYLKNAGRIKASKAFFGNLFGVKPIIVADAIGNNYAFKKAKGRKNALDEVVALIKENIHPNSPLFIEHADCLEDAEYVKEAVKDKVSTIYLSSLGPIIGASVGPDSITVNFYAKNKVTIIGEE